MIILDSVNKFLQVNNTVSGLDGNITSVVSYWSIDNATNVWTPRSFEVKGNPAIILPAPAAGETRVMESAQITIGNTFPAANILIISLQVAGVTHSIASFTSKSSTGGTPESTALEALSLIILDRNGNIQVVRRGPLL